MRRLTVISGGFRGPPRGGCFRVGMGAPFSANLAHQEQQCSFSCSISTTSISWRQPMARLSLNLSMMTWSTTLFLGQNVLVRQVETARMKKFHHSAIRLTRSKQPQISVARCRTLPMRISGSKLEPHQYPPSRWTCVHNIERCHLVLGILKLTVTSRSLHSSIEVPSFLLCFPTFTS